MLRLRFLALAGAVATTSLLSTTLVASAPAASASTGPSAPVSFQVRPGTSAAPSLTGTDHFLNSDSCPDATFCMAVGNYHLGGHTPAFSAMLSAGNWVEEPVPSPAVGLNLFANQVSCSSATSCLFVGDHFAGRNGPFANLAEAWNGSSWSIVTDVGPRGAPTSALFDVSCPTSSFCLVVGSAGSVRHSQSAAYTWTNGTTWRRIAVPHPRRARNSELAGIACFDATHCMAVGNYTSAAGRFLPYSARWLGGHWKLLATPAVRGQRQTLFEGGTSCPTATTCVAVGNTVDNTRGRFFHAFAEVWSGGRWHVSTLRRAPSIFFAASCPAANRCFASGFTFPSIRSYAHQLIETWNGRTWTTQRPAQTAGLGGSLQGISCVSAVSCETAGFAFSPGVSNSDEAITEVWDGHSWTGQVTPNP
jgi:hypothetical protein